MKFPAAGQSVANSTLPRALDIATDAKMQPEELLRALLILAETQCNIRQKIHRLSEVVNELFGTDLICQKLLMNFSLKK